MVLYAPPPPPRFLQAVTLLQSRGRIRVAERGGERRIHPFSCQVLPFPERKANDSCRTKPGFPQDGVNYEL